MLSLPPELLLAIIPYLENSDLKVFRLCNKFLASHAGRTLFHTLHIFFTRNDFARLERIANSENVRHLIRCINYVGSRYEPHLSIERWQLHYNRRRFMQMGALVWLRNPYEAYKRTSDEQSTITAEGYDLRVWASVLPQLPNIECMRVLMLEASKPDHGLLHRQSRMMFCEPDGDFDYDAHHNHGYPGYKYMGFRQATSVLEPLLTIQSHRPQLKTLHLEGVNWMLFSKLCNFATTFETAFSSLCDLRLDLFTTQQLELERLRPATLEREGVQLFVKAAPSLRRIRVSMTPAHYRLELNEIFALDTIWPDLAVVELQGIAFDLCALANFTRRHRGTLRKLCLKKPVLLGPSSWASYVGSLSWPEDATDPDGPLALSPNNETMPRFGEQDPFEGAARVSRSEDCVFVNWL